VRLFAICSCTVPKGRKKGQQEQQQRINPVEEFGKQLEAAGFAKHGQETMISGVTGQEMPCNIYIGLVYYQRLRHMVSDKFQVCAAALFGFRVWWCSG
jgi:DNA-directed RNA polymerase beta subunit